MNKIIITHWNNKILTTWFHHDIITQFQLESEDNQSILNNIYIGKVKNIVKNIDSAFVDLGNEQMAYYNLSENRKHHFTDPNKTGSLKAGDEIVVQVIKDAVKTKDPVVSSNLSFTGRYCVLTTGKTMIGFSSKITNQLWKTQIKEALQSYKDDCFGIIIRTNAKHVEPDVIVEEYLQLKQRCQTLLQESLYRTCYSVLEQEPPAYLSCLRDTYQSDVEEIITDDPEIFDSINTYLNIDHSNDKINVTLYQDKMISMLKLYNLEKELSRSLEKKVWLKSGGYLVIEPTEALVVIDVNTGKYSGKKNVAETILKINLEAALMIGLQLRRRNLSGIIIIDFIDMARQADRELLVSTLKDIVSSDPIKTTVVGITPLNLVEVTRKKIRRPLSEQLLAP